MGNLPTSFLALTVLGCVLLYLVYEFVPLPAKLKRLAMVILGGGFLIWFAINFFGVYGIGL